MYYSSLKEPKQREKIAQVLTTLRKLQALGRVDWHPFLAVLKAAPPLPGLPPRKRAGAREGWSVHVDSDGPAPFSASAGRTLLAPGSGRPGRRRERAAQERASWGQPCTEEEGPARSPASPRLRPRATARVPRVRARVPGFAGLSRVYVDRSPPCPHAGAAPAVRGATAAGPGGTWPPASQAGLSGPWGCPARPRGRRP